VRIGEAVSRYIHRPLLNDLRQHQLIIVIVFLFNFTTSNDNHHLSVSFVVS
jgi:hypothetical protein